jgi:hypothetical protein
MNFKSQAQALNQFLVTYFPIWGQEVMNEYPKTILDYPIDWINLLAPLSKAELFQIDSKQSYEQIKGSNFCSFIEKIQELSFIPFIEKTSEIPLEDWAYTGVKFKKKHEIQQIAPKIKQIYQETKFHHVNDIGGGVGHLSRILAHYHSIPAYSIDQNKEFQTIGEKRMGQFRKLKNAADVVFINMKFGDNDNNSRQIFTKDSFSLGLHTCGNLAIKLIEENSKHETLGLLSFGCCYHLIRQSKHFFMSNFFQNNNFIALNLFGLSLATRSHAENNFENYVKKERVKNYRYGFHLFMMKHFNRNDYLDVGECPLHIYDEPISNYIMLKLNVLNISHEFQNSYIENFYYSKEIQAELRTMFLCNIIRWQLGRALEVFLLLDRSIYLEENGYTVKLEQYFKEALSPRNIGILGVRAPSS